jgi:uncharacterized protein
MKKLLFFLLFLFPILLGVPWIHGFAVQIPDPAGDIYVQDFANVLSENEKQELIELGTYLDDQTEAQIAVLTVQSLENETVEEYALEAFRQYGLGGKKHDNGVLLLLALDERKIKVEVGYGLEGALPDGKIGRILDSYALPYLENNEINLAIVNTYKQLFNEVAKEYHLDQQADAEGFEYTETEDGPSLLTVIIFTLIFLGIIFLDYRFLGGAFTLTLLRILAAILRNGGGRGGGGFGGGSSPRTGGGGSSGGGGASRGW